MDAYAAIAEAMMVAFGTASSSATLPLTMACCEKRGISHKVCSFVLPLGATLNMDATALFQIISYIFNNLLLVIYFDNLSGVIVTSTGLIPSCPA